MLWLEARRRWYREGEGRHGTERTAEGRDLRVVRKRDYHLWLFLAQMGRWENGQSQGIGTLGLPVAGWIWWKTFPLVVPGPIVWRVRAKSRYKVWRSQLKADGDATNASARSRS